MSARPAVVEVTVRRSSVRESLAQSKDRRREGEGGNRQDLKKKGERKAGGNKEESTVFRVAI